VQVTRPKDRVWRSCSFKGAPRVVSPDQPLTGLRRRAPVGIEARGAHRSLRRRPAPREAL